MHVELQIDKIERMKKSCKIMLHIEDKHQREKTILLVKNVFVRINGELIAA